MKDDPLVKEGYLQMELKCSNTEPEKGVGVGPSGSGPSVSPMNEQDVDGLHHLMARSFAEKAELDQVSLSISLCISISLSISLYLSLSLSISLSISLSLYLSLSLD